uniref:RRM domain-containing protein n=1 Tax=Corethron hystrix TaxID=216773 RepID=A0A7S1BYN3_9STRA
MKRTARVIFRNLAFRADADDLRRAASAYGSVVAVDLPAVVARPAAAGAKDDARSKLSHRGFGFVTFGDAAAARKACAAGELEIRGRKSSVSMALSRDRYEKGKAAKLEETTAKDETSKQEEEESDGDSESTSESEDDDDGDDSEDDSDEDDDSDSDSDSDDGSRQQDEKKKMPVSADPEELSRTVFLRNLSYETTRRSILSALGPRFGTISKVRLVMDGEDRHRGTAFVLFQNVSSAEEAIEAASRQDGGGLVVDGRIIMADAAMTREMASTVTKRRPDASKTDAADNKQQFRRDRRNLYLRNEGYVLPTDGWEDVPPSDREKRGRAHNEKAMRLRSPLFHVNAKRLSVKNLANHVDEAGIKRLAAAAAVNGLERGLVSEEDVSQHLRAGGDLEPLKCVGEYARVPSFDTKVILSSTN